MDLLPQSSQSFQVISGDVHRPVMKMFDRETPYHNTARGVESAVMARIPDQTGGRISKQQECLWIKNTYLNRNTTNWGMYGTILFMNASKLSHFLRMLV
jgi:hypothetical protein